MEAPAESGKSLEEMIGEFRPFGELGGDEPSDDDQTGDEACGETVEGAEEDDPASDPGAIEEAAEGDSTELPASDEAVDDDSSTEP